MEYQDGQAWRTYVTEQLKEIGIICLNPYNHPFIDSTSEDNETRKQLKQYMEDEEFEKVQQFMKGVRNEDLRCVDLVDAIFAYIDPKIPTFGSVEELSWGSRMRKPAFIVIEGGVKKCPLWLLSMFPLSNFFNTFEEALEEIYKIDSGKVDMSARHWHLLKEEYR